MHPKHDYSERNPTSFSCREALWGAHCLRPKYDYSVFWDYVAMRDGMSDNLGRTLCSYYEPQEETQRVPEEIRGRTMNIITDADSTGRTTTCTTYGPVLALDRTPMGLSQSPKSFMMLNQRRVDIPVRRV